MNISMQLPKFTMGIGDRFARQGQAQLQPFINARADGIEVYPVWNKSNREHLTVGTGPASVRAEADAAVEMAGWNHPYFVDADHINLDTVDRFVGSSDFFTIDVGDAIGGGCDSRDVERFAARHRDTLDALDLSGLGMDASLAGDTLAATAAKYLPAVTRAAATYRRIAEKRGNLDFVTEVSMDETDFPQSPQELFLILAALADAQVPLQTLAPKFSGRFNKGVDYVGDVALFELEFEADIIAVAAAVKTFGLPGNLKLSIHSGSDKFAIYPGIAAILKRHHAGVHVKTAGTTWLAEVEGLVEAGGNGLAFARELYAGALNHFGELCAPYATVLDVRRDALPSAATVAGWDSDDFREALLHDPGCPRYRPDLRQLMHVAYKLAAQAGPRYLDLIAEHRDVVARRVTSNIDRHLRLIFG